MDQRTVKDDQQLAVSFKHPLETFAVEDCITGTALPEITTNILQERQEAGSSSMSFSSSSNSN